MVKDVLRYYISVTKNFKRYSYPPILLAPIARTGTEYVPTLIAATVINKVSSENRPPISSLVPLVLAFLFVPMISETIWRYIAWSMNRAEALATEKIANDTFKDLIHRSYDFHANNFTGSLVSKTSRFISAYIPLFDLLIFNIMGFIPSLIFASVVLFIVSWPVGIAFVIILLVYGFTSYRMARKRYKYNFERSQYESLQTGQLADSLGNVITVKTFAKEKYEQHLYAKITKQLRHKIIRSWDYANVPMDLFSSMTVTLMDFIALGGALLAVYYFDAEIGTVFLVLTYIRTLTSKFWDFSKIIRTIENNLSNAAEMMEILNEEKQVVDQDSAQSITNVQGSIEFKDVSFAYTDAKHKLLFNNLSLSIPAGQSVGLVGPSGGGKTTITKLLLRFMDIRGGSITIDDQDIFHTTQLSLRDAITYVPQEPVLFHRSIRENIAYGDPNAPLEKIVDAAKKAHADSFIKKLPNGYDTVVGERGIKLSGGQRQRIALARAILKNAPIIVLDEATSALDSESERHIQQALSTLIEGRTTIVVAHRLSTIKKLDRILVLDEGKIIEDGNHETLSQKKDGVYAQLWKHQSGGMIE